MREQAERTEATAFPSDPRLLAAACGLLFIVKVWLAARLDLHSDEVFYWLASTMPAPAYSDLPFVTALLAGLGSALDPGNPLATRALFLAGGSCLPAVIYWVSLPFTGRKDALQAAFLSICIPLGGFLGLLAVPDVPMLLCGLLSLGFLDRALRTDGLVYWLGAGAFVAFGLCTHYRFALFPAGAMLYLLLHRRDVRRNGKFWLAAGIAALGLLPMLWANLPGNMGSASFYFLERHPWRFNAAGLSHVPLQALLVTPPLYALLLYSAWLMIDGSVNPWDTHRGANPWDTHRGANPWDTHRGADGTPMQTDGRIGGDGSRGAHNSRRGSRDTQVNLLLCAALPQLLVYALLAPWSDANSTTEHWPLPGYFPLLVFAPEALRRTYAWLAGPRRQSGADRRASRQSRAALVVKAIPAIGFSGTLLVLAGIGSQSLQTQLQPLVGPGVLSEKMAGWGEFAEYTGRLLRENFDEWPVIVTDNYHTAARLQYAGVAADALTLDTDKAVRDGRFRQFELWERTGEFAHRRAHAPLLFITEDSSLNVAQKRALIARACGLADSLEQIDQLSLFEGDKRFGFYRGGVSAGIGAPAARPCPYPPQAWIDRPAPGAILSGTITVSGWAYNEDLGVERVLLLLDGAVVAQAEYGLPRPDVVEVREIQTDPNQPNLGFRAEIDAADYAAGRRELSIRIIDSRGNAIDYGQREVSFERP